MAARRPVPRAVLLALAAALAAQLAWRASHPPPAAAAQSLASAPSLAALRLASLGEPQAASRLLMLGLQAFDDPAGAVLPLRQLDYRAVSSWLGVALDLDPCSRYPLLAASRVYAAVADPQRARQMLDFVEQRFEQDPRQRWPWLLEARLSARYRLHDEALVARYDQQLQAAAPLLPVWAQALSDAHPGASELASQRVLAGAMLQHGQVQDANEAHQLEQRLRQLEPGRTIQAPPPARSPAHE